MRLLTFDHEFVTYIPEDLDEGRLYISMVHATVAHRCCCGCGNEVFTPLSPRDWSLTFDGDTVSLDPSIGNWSFACQSHYWIDHSQVRWAGRWSRREIEARRERDRQIKAAYSGQARALEDAPGDGTSHIQPGLTKEACEIPCCWRKL